MFNQIVDFSSQFRNKYLRSFNSQILIYSSMLLRRSRQHFHGASNRSLSAQKIHAMHPTSTFLPPDNKKQPLKKHITTTSYLKKRNINEHKQNHRYFDDKDAQNTQQLCNTQFELRRKYQGCRHIIKLLNNWGVTSKGCLNRQQFKEQVKKKLGANIQEQQLDQLFAKHSKNGQQIDVQNLIELFKGKTEGVPFNFRTFSTEESQPFREKLIDDLNQNIKNYSKLEKKELTHYTLNSFVSKFNSAVSKMKQINEGHINQNKTDFFQELLQLKKFNEFQKSLLAHIQKSSDFQEMRSSIIGNKSVDSLLADPILRNTRTFPLKTQQKKQDQVEESLQYTKNMRSSPHLLQNVLTTQLKRKDFDPKTFYHINQAKTRFGRSLFTKESTGWVSTQNGQTVASDQKDKIMDTLKSQQQLKKARYQNKLQKMRQFRTRQLESVAQRSSAIQQRQMGRLLRIREQQQAYNYVNFIKKRWE